MLEFRLLGPVEVVVDGSRVELGKGMERVLLAALVLAAGRPLSVSELEETLWGERAPATAPEMIRNAVARLRGRFGHGVIETTPAGYRVVAADDQVDVRRFERAAAAGSDALTRGEVETAATLLREALSLWRGRAAPELDDVAALAPVLGALEELRLQVEEDRIEAELELGRASALVRELELLHETHPYRERLLGQLMLALYRSGRQKDALDRYSRGRRRLVDDVGLEPGPSLQELQHRILEHDPVLRARAPTPRRTVAPPAPRRRVPVAVAIVVGVAVAASAVAVAWPRRSEPAIPVRGLVGLDTSGRVRFTAPAPVRGGLVAADARHVWLASSTARVVVELSPPSTATRVIRIPHLAFSLVAVGGSAWVGEGYDGTLTRIDANGHVVSTFRPEPQSKGRLPLGATDGAVWVASQDRTLTRLDPTSGHEIQTYRGVPEANALAADAEGVWLAAATDDVVARFDQVKRRVIRFPLGGRPSAVATGAGAVWALTPEEGTLWHIDEKRKAVVGYVSVPTSAVAVATTPGLVWVAAGATLLLIDPRTNTIVRTLSLGRLIGGLAAAGDRLWVSIG